MKTQIKLALGLGILSLFMRLLGHLALTDIYHGETEVSLEWNILRVSALVFAFFVTFALTTFRKILETI